MKNRTGGLIVKLNTIKHTGLAICFKDRPCPSGYIFRDTKDLREMGAPNSCLQEFNES